MAAFGRTIHDANGGLRRFCCWNELENSCFGLFWGAGQILKAGPDAAPQKLMITILDGDGALNNIRQRDAREPIVQVTDENHKPVAGAAVLFAIHDGAHGAGATFGGSQTLTVTTGPDGIAHASGLQLAKSPGSFTISASASVATAAGVVAAAETIIHQSNIIGALSTASSASASGASSTASSAGASSTAAHTGLSRVLHLGVKGNLVVAGAAAAAVAVVVVVVVTQNNSTSLTLGSSTVGHP
jgi:hypothetical protein